MAKLAIQTLPAATHIRVRIINATHISVTRRHVTHINATHISVTRRHVTHINVFRHLLTAFMSPRITTAPSIIRPATASIMPSVIIVGAMVIHVMPTNATHINVIRHHVTRTPATRISVMLTPVTRIAAITLMCVIRVAIMLVEPEVQEAQQRPQSRVVPEAREVVAAAARFC